MRQSPSSGACRHCFWLQTPAFAACLRRKPAVPSSDTDCRLPPVSERNDLVPLEPFLFLALFVGERFIRCNGEPHRRLTVAQIPQYGISAQISDYHCSIQRHDIYSFRPLQMRTVLPTVPIAAGFPDRVLDLLLALGSQILAKTAPMENREPAPEVALDPVLGLLNVSPARHTHASIVVLLFARACRRGKGVPVFFHPAPFLGRNPLNQTRTVARNPDPPVAQPASVTKQTARRAGAPAVKRRRTTSSAAKRERQPCGDLVTPRHSGAAASGRRDTNRRSGDKSRRRKTACLRRTSL